MRSVAKIALGTALGILVVALVAVGGFVVLGYPLGGGGELKPARSVSDIAAVPDADGDGRADAEDPDLYSANSDAYRRVKNKRHATTPKPGSAMTACDANIRVNAATTSCPFAQNVFLAYWMDYDSPGVFADSSGLPAYSGAVDEMFTVDCGGDDPVVCRAGDGGYVTFPMSAVAAYTIGDAKRYAASHDTGGVDPGDLEASEPPVDGSQSSGSEGCDPNYAGACLDVNSYDYDCEGGSGDGPDYTARVEVVGDDPYDLDRDGDGIACDV
jgi:hypothetical protein